MSQPWDISIAANSGGPVRLAGKATGEPSGGSQTWDQFALYSGPIVSVPVDAGNHNLPWGSLGSGLALLDIVSDPEFPTLAAGGICAVVAVVELSEQQDAGKGFQAILHLDFTGNDFVNEETASGDVLIDGKVLVSLSSTGYVPTGGVIAVTVNVASDGAARDFKLREASIQMLPGGP